MSVLVVGGAGYIGSHAVYRLIEENHHVVVIDNLSTGHQEAIHSEAVFYKGDVRDKLYLQYVFQKEQIDAVLHFAAHSLVAESMEHPLKYYNNNVNGTLNLLGVMNQFNVKRIVFSSTAATYGEPPYIPILESHPTTPTNPYGQTKLTVEQLLEWCDKAYGMKYVALRYFNVAGAKSSGEIGEDHTPESHLIPLVLEVALGKREFISIFGNDYDTKDGTCIRDYIHVEDLIDAHVLALAYLNSGGKSSIMNLGNAQGFSVFDIISAAREITNHPIPIKIDKRRQGDSSCLIASYEKATQTLGWRPIRTSIESIMKDAWNWHLKNPNGYSGS